MSSPELSIRLRIAWPVPVFRPPQRPKFDTPALCSAQAPVAPASLDSPPRVRAPFQFASVRIEHPRITNIAPLSAVPHMSHWSKTRPHRHIVFAWNADSRPGIHLARPSVLLPACSNSGAPPEPATSIPARANPLPPRHPRPLPSPRSRSPDRASAPAATYPAPIVTLVGDSPEESVYPGLCA